MKEIFQAIHNMDGNKKYPFKLDTIFVTVDNKSLFAKYIISNYVNDVDYIFENYFYTGTLYEKLLWLPELYFKNEDDVLMLKLKFGI